MSSELTNDYGLVCIQLSSAFYSCDPPWLGHRSGITFRVDLPVATRRSDPPAVRREAALRAIAELPHPDVTIWSDGSARGGRNRAAQALIQFHHLNREETVRAPAGAVCSSLRAELTAMREAFAAVAGLEDGELASTKSVRLLTDSRSGLQLLGRGPANQTMALAAEVWRLLSAEHPHRERHRDGAPRRSLRLKEQTEARAERSRQDKLRAQQREEQLVARFAGAGPLSRPDPGAGPAP
ncbi:hypothetical protein FJT64_018202 [Amphibalanus amphitrite]|uniref:Uncharacterized protein n=1 Tax=Amphibalanus amphitrite TaxID=1232801 RepID=A0A6A4V9A5_AMPAM|nr:hypothetical protein FJT64_012083 [Amphibalanus amphitrite]KAF0310945.1 hypothetical protein FJT64_018202 [Amphibalanus amphitrite]